MIADDVVMGEQILRGAFFVDTTPLIGHVRQEMGIEPDGLAAHRASGYEARVARQREEKHGAPGDSAYA